MIDNWGETRSSAHCHLAAALGVGRGCWLCLEVLIRGVLVSVHLHLGDMALLHRCILGHLDEATAARCHRALSQDHDTDNDDNKDGDAADDNAECTAGLHSIGSLHGFLLHIRLQVGNLT